MPCRRHVTAILWRIWGKIDEVDRIDSAATHIDPKLARMWMAGCGSCNKRGGCKQHAKGYNGFYKERSCVVHEGEATTLRHQRPDNGEFHKWAHACDVALAMTGWLLLERVGKRLSYNHPQSWCQVLNLTAEVLDMARG